MRFIRKRINPTNSFVAANPPLKQGYCIRILDSKKHRLSLPLEPSAEAGDRGRILEKLFFHIQKFAKCTFFPRIQQTRYSGGFINSIRKGNKPIAIFFTLNFLTSLFAPNIAYALTSGPTAPEYTSFEPVDTTDMVNLATGDFVYNLPLLEVPGPAGGYPLSLSYHAGIQPNEEASWVGLGWTLNPGAINRTVNGYPDDQYDVVRTRRDYNSGGDRHTFSVGVGLPSVSFGLSISNDSYQGLGVGSFLSLSPSLPIGESGVGIGPNFTIGTDGYGNNYSGFGAGITFHQGIKAAQGLGATVGLNTNFKSFSLSGGINYGSIGKGGLSQGSLVGASISSTGSKPRASVVGISASQHNAKANNASTRSEGWSMPVPLPGFTLTLGYKYLRYWIDETSDVKVIGTYYGNETSGKNYDDYSYDSYALTEVEVDYVDQDPEKDRGGSFPAYDYYSVNAQGLSGSMRPFHSRTGHLRRQNLKQHNDDSKYEIEYMSGGRELPKPHFRFDNDFSNSFTYNENARLNTSTMWVENADPVSGEIRDGSLAGSRYIESFTNEEIRSQAAKNAGLIDYQPYSSRELDRYFLYRSTEDRLSYVNEYDLRKLIGAYKITNESGVTYHYSLPVYAYDEYQLNQDKDKPKGGSGEIYTETENHEPYAYTWLLTGITGPDFVDRNNDGQLDDGDWGYWVKFDYGRWTDKYGWRSPYEGFHSDINSQYETYSYGYKELYYLNKISTKSHVAIFEKQIRADAKGIVDSGWPSEGLDEGGFEPFTFTTSGTGASYPVYPISTLRLNNIYLLNKEDDVNLKNRSSSYNHKFTYQFNTAVEFYIEHHQGQNVIDIKDLDQIKSDGETYRSYLTNNALRVISFDHSYDLQHKLPNSFDENGSMYQSTLNETEDDLKLGKLTLNGIDFLGKGGKAVVPGTKFSYESESASYTAKFRRGPTSSFEMRINGAVSGLAKGDIIEVLDYHFLITEDVTPGSWIDCKKLNNSTEIIVPLTTLVDGQQMYFNGEDVSMDKTKNPPHGKNHYDIWGFYKSDYQNLGDENLSRMVTPTSAKNVDAWSLKSIKSGLGAEIAFDYESDRYINPKLYESTVITFTDAENSKLFLPGNLIDLLTSFEVGQELEILAFYKWSPFLLGPVTCPSLPPILEDKFKAERLTTSIVGKGVEDLKPYIQIGTLNPTPPSDMRIFYNCQDGSEEGNWVRYTNPEIIASNTNGFKNESINYLGGGLRVSKISVKGEKTVSTQYKYSNGTTSFEPFGLNNAIYFESVEDEDKKIYQKALNDEFSKLLQISREVQSPGVIYEYVTVSEEVNGDLIPGKQVYNFQVFEEDFIERTAISNTSGNFVEPVTIKDYTTRVGNLKSVKTYGANDQLLMETSTIYQHNLDEEEVPASTDPEDYWNDVNDSYRVSLADKFNNQGATQEMFTEYRKVKDGGTYKHQKVLSRKEYYPSIVVGIRTKNYKTGITSETRNLAFDYYSGAPTVTYSDDGYGNKNLNKSVPAYHYYSEMGLGVNGGRHMLVQEGTSYTYLMNDSFTPDDFTYDYDFNLQAVGLLGASAQTWSRDIPSIEGNTGQSQSVWRKHQIMSYITKPSDVMRSDGSIESASFEELPLGNSISEAEGWQTNSEIKLYDINSHALEAMDINGNYAATKYDARNERIIASIANGRYSEFAFSGGENESSLIFGSRLTDPSAHTGDYVVRSIDDGADHSAFRLELIPGKYRVRYWTDAPASKVKWINPVGAFPETPKTEFETRSIGSWGNWHLMEAIVNLNEKGDLYITSFSQAKFDDFRVHPVDATMTSYVYNEWGELSDILDANNFFTHYEYDDMGRLKSITRETLDNGPVKVSESAIYYKNGN